MSQIAADLSWIQALGWSLIHFLWQGALVGIVYALVRALLPKERSSARYLIGLVALAILVLCPLLSFFLLWSPASSASIPLGEVMVGVSEQSTSLLATATSDSLDGWLPLLVAGWLAGVVLMVWRAVFHWRALDRIATHLAWREVEIENMLIRVAQRFGSLPGARVLVSASIDTPTLIGWFKPVILLPVAVVIGFPRHQLELILAHELGHLRRYDHLVNLGQAVIETLLFYHPVVHWISREVRHEREVCCDNLVLRLTDSEPQEYARTLAALEDVRQLAPQLAVAASGGMLLDRVRRIVGAAAPRTHHRRSLVGVWLIAAGFSIALPAALFLPHTGGDDESVSVERLVHVDALPDKPMVDLELTTPSTRTLVFAAMPSIGAYVGSDLESATAPRSEIEIRQVPVETLAVAQVDAPSMADLVNEAPMAPPMAGMSLESIPAPSASAQIVERLGKSPRLVRQISPNYPDNGFGSQHSKVDFEFSIDRSGSVRDIQVVSGDRHGAFAVAARDALRLWKFDPLSVSGRGAEKFRQGFEFVSKSYVASGSVDGPCTPPIGSHVCRPGRGSTAVMAAAEKSATARALALVSDFQDVEDICMPSTGSHLCRNGSSASVALKVRPEQATSAHVIVLAGGSN